MKKLILLFWFVPLIGFAQNPLITKTIKKIEFKEDTIKSVFDWIADHIDYDVKKLKKITKTANPQSTEKREERIEDVLKSKKGVCQHYSELLDEIVKELGYESFMVTGYTKKENEEVDRTFGHAWNAIKVNGQWRLYDVTWGSGGVRNNKKYIKKYKPEWYNVAPDEMIKTHIPFDPIWQLLENPIPYVSFDMDLLAAASKEKYNFQDKINTWFTLSKKKQLSKLIERMEAMKAVGDCSPLVENYLKNRKQHLTYHQNKEKYAETSAKTVEINAANTVMREVANTFNQYIAAKNNRFKSKSADSFKPILNTLKEKTTTSLNTFTSIQVDDPKLKSFLKNKAIPHATQMLKRINTEVTFLENL